MTAQPYTVRYVDDKALERDFCLYASNAYDARITAMEMVQHIHDHPNSITHILREADHFDW